MSSLLFRSAKCRSRPRLLLWLRQLRLRYKTKQKVFVGEFNLRLQITIIKDLNEVFIYKIRNQFHFRFSAELRSADAGST